MKAIVNLIWPWKNLNRLHKVLLGLNILFGLFITFSYLSTYVNPNTTTLFAFFGLAYYLFLYTLIGFTIYWIIRKKKLYLWSLFFILLGFNHFNNFFQLNLFGTHVPEGEKSIKVMTYNVRLFDLYNWSDNKSTRDEIFTFLEKENADIICFQEFYHQDNSSSFQTKDILLEKLDAKNIHEGYTHLLKKQQHFGVVTLSKFPIISKGEIKFSNDDNNNCIYSDIKINDDTVRVYNMHLASIRLQKADYDAIGEKNSKTHYTKKEKKQKILSRLSLAFKNRAEQSKKVKEHMNNSPYRVIACGDFNDTPISYCYKLMSEGLNDAFKESGLGTSGTYIGKLPSYRIDYILHSKEINSYEYQKHSEELSDHHAVSCEVIL